MHDDTQARRIPGFPSYFATPDGKVYTTYRSWREMAQGLDRHGYRTVSLFRPDRTRVRVAVHRIILDTFVGSKPNSDDVARHLNGDRQDNRVENLAWGSQSQNIADAIKHGTVPQIGRFGEQAHRAKLTEAQVLEVERRARSGCEFLREIAQDFGISIRQVVNIRDHLNWRHLWPADEANPKSLPVGPSVAM